jgi:tRNA threonylcarbamoyladenosine biosynthesis protein TsaE
MMEFTFKLEDIHEAAKRFWKEVGDRKVFAFYGAMGSGKTTYIHALCDEKKVSSHVASPTFSIINEYIYPGGKIFHIDLYRLKDEEEAVRAGIDDCIYSEQICLVEWAEKADGLFPETVVNVFISAIDENHRKVGIEYRV